MGLPEAFIEHLREVAEEGRREAPPGLEEHFAKRRVTAAYLGVMEVALDLQGLGLPTILDDPEIDGGEGPELESDSERPVVNLASRGLADARRREIAPWNLTEEESRNPDGTYKFHGD